MGTRADLEPFVGPGTKVLEHRAGTILPGFVEPHLHLVSSALVFDGIDCSPYASKTLDAVLAALKAAVATTPPGQAVVGQLFDPSLLPGQPDLTADLLDQISTQVPIVVMNASQHFFYVNSAAYAAVGGHCGNTIRRAATTVPATANSPASSPRRGDDPVHEGAAQPDTGGARKGHHRNRRHGRPSRGDLRPRGGHRSHRGNPGSRPAAPDLRPGRIPGARLDVAVGREPRRFHCSRHQAGLRGRQAALADHRWVSDGSNQGYTGYMRENYLGRDTRGVANFTPEQLAANFAKTIDAGWPIMCHANGDAALDMVMAAFAASAELPSWDAAKRHRTEHSSLLHDEHIAAMASLGITRAF